MIIEETQQLLITRGFAQLETNARDVGFFIKSTSENEYDGVKLCMMVYNVRGAYVTTEQIAGMAHQIENTLLLKGFRNIEIMCLIFTDQPERDKGLAQTDIKFWLIDVKDKELIIYENQPDEYEAIRGGIEYDLQCLEERRSKNQGLFNKTYRLPYATMLFVAINILVFLILDTIGDVYDSEFMIMHGADNWELVFKNGEYYRLFTSMFLHFGMDHLASNMLMLFVTGRLVEEQTGPVKFSIIYLLSGIAASFVSCFYYMTRNELVVSAGASGAIFGIMGALAMIELKNRRNDGGNLGQRMIIIFGFMILDGYVSEGVDFVAHFAGLVFGLMLTAILYRVRDEV